MEDEIDQMYSRFFVNRGWNTSGGMNSKDVQSFLKPNYEKDQINPFIFRDMEKAVDRIDKALENKEKILLYTDYDCDGIPGAVILYDFFKKIEISKRQKDKENLNAASVASSKNNKDLKIEDKEEFSICFDNYIPHRHKEGYGIHKNVIEKYIKDGYTLMITADLGITNIEEVKYAEENGMNVILTDHHLPRVGPSKARPQKQESLEIIPNAFAVINTQLSYEKYENKGICGAATVWKLVNAFLNKNREKYGIVDGWEKWLLDMVALATVADLMPITGENRMLVYYGLKVMQKSPRMGLQKMLSLAKVNQKDITETDLSFTIAPRINAAGRLDHPKTAFEALAYQNINGIYAAEKLEKLNTERKSVVIEINKEVLEKLKQDKSPIVFIGDKSWQVGVVGLIAQKAAEITGKTSFVWGSDDGEICRGSSRSGSDNINVTDLASKASELLINFGGHEAAGGISFNIENENKVREKLIEVVNKKEFVLIKKNKSEDNFVDMLVTGRGINKNLYEKVRSLAPFGIECPAPIIQISGERVMVKRFGKENNHTEILVDGVSCIKFGTTKEEHEKLAGQKSWLGNIEKENWKSGYRLKLL